MPRGCGRCFSAGCKVRPITAAACDLVLRGNTMITRLAKGGRRYPTPALEKGLDILELFASEQQGLTKTDVARRLGRTVSEVFRMLLCLEERGYIARSKDGERFHLTLQLF